MQPFFFVSTILHGIVFDNIFDIDQAMREIRKYKPDIVGLSGLITPSLNEMVKVAEELKHQNINIPLLIGGATTSRLHTALKILPKNLGPTIHVIDASRSIHILNALINPIKKKIFVTDIKKEYSQLVDKHLKGNKPNLITLLEARKNKKENNIFSNTYTNIR